jgi:hypothetical protein
VEHAPRFLELEQIVCKEQQKECKKGLVTGNDIHLATDNCYFEDVFREVSPLLDDKDACSFVSAFHPTV